MLTNTGRSKLRQWLTRRWLSDALEVGAVLGNHLLERDAAGTRHDGVEPAPPVPHHAVTEGEDVILAMQVGEHELDDPQHPQLGVPGRAHDAVLHVFGCPLGHVLISDQSPPA